MLRQGHISTTPASITQRPPWSKWHSEHSYRQGSCRFVRGWSFQHSRQNFHRVFSRRRKKEHGSCFSALAHRTGFVPSTGRDKCSSGALWTEQYRKKKDLQVRARHARSAVGSHSTISSNSSDGRNKRNSRGVGDVSLCRRDSIFICKISQRCMNELDFVLIQLK